MNVASSVQTVSKCMRLWCITYVLFLELWTTKKDTFQFCFPGLLGIQRNPNWKEFLKSCESFLKKSQFFTFTLIDLNPGFGRPWLILKVVFPYSIFLWKQLGAAKPMVGNNLPSWLMYLKILVRQLPCLPYYW